MAGASAASGNTSETIADARPCAEQELCVALASEGESETSPHACQCTDALPCCFQSATNRHAPAVCDVMELHRNFSPTLHGLTAHGYHAWAPRACSHGLLRLRRELHQATRRAAVAVQQESQQQQPAPRHQLAGQHPQSLQHARHGSAQQQRALMRCIKACNTEADVLALLPRLDSASARHISAALTHLAQLQGRSPGRSSERRRRTAAGANPTFGSRGGRQVPSQPSVASLLLQRFCSPPSPELLQQWGPREASNALWAIAKLHLRPAAAHTQVLLDHVLHGQQSPNSQDLANAIYAAALLGHTPEPAWLYAFEAASLQFFQPPQQPSTTQIRSASQASSSQPTNPTAVSRRGSVFTPRELSSVLYAYALLECVPSEHWLVTFSAASLPKLCLLEPQPLCTVTWAAARVMTIRDSKGSSKTNLDDAASNRNGRSGDDGGSNGSHSSNSPHSPWQGAAVQPAWPPISWRLAAQQAVWEHLPVMSWQLLASALWSTTRLAVGEAVTERMQAARSHSQPTPATHNIRGADGHDRSSSSSSRSTPSGLPSEAWMLRFLAAAKDAVSQPLPTCAIQSDTWHLADASGASIPVQLPGSGSSTNGNHTNTYVSPQFPAHALCNMLYALVDLGYRPSNQWLDGQLCASLAPSRASDTSGSTGSGLTVAVGSGARAVESDGARDGSDKQRPGASLGLATSAADPVPLPVGSDQAQVYLRGVSDGRQVMRPLHNASGHSERQQPQRLGPQQPHSQGTLQLMQQQLTQQEQLSVLQHTVQLQQPQQPEQPLQLQLRLRPQQTYIARHVQAPNVPHLDATSILVSCVRLRYVPPPAAAVVLLRSTYAGMNGYTPALLSHLLWAVSKLRLLPLGPLRAAWLSRFWACSHPVLHLLTVNELTKLLTAIAVITQQHQMQQQQQQDQQRRQHGMTARGSGHGVNSASGITSHAHSAQPAAATATSSSNAQHDAGKAFQQLAATDPPADWCVRALQVLDVLLQHGSTGGGGAAGTAMAWPSHARAEVPQDVLQGVAQLRAGARRRLAVRRGVQAALQQQQLARQQLQGQPLSSPQQQQQQERQRLPHTQLLPLLWALGSTPGLRPATAPLRIRLVAAATAALPQLGPHQLDRLPLLLAACGCRRVHDNSRFQRAFLARTISTGTLNQLSGLEMCRLLSGVAAFGCYPNRQWLTTVLNRLQAPDLLQGVTPDALASLLSSLQFLTDQPGWRPSSAKGAARTAAAASRSATAATTSGSDVGSSASGGAAWEVSHPALSAALHTACARALASPQCRPADPFRLLYPLHCLGCPPRGVPWWESAYGAMQPLLARMSGSQLANLLYLLAVFATEAEAWAKGRDKVQTHSRGRSQAGQVADAGVNPAQGQGAREAPEFIAAQAQLPGQAHAAAPEESLVLAAAGGMCGFLPPSDGWVEAAFQRITEDFSSLDAKNVARLLCALARLPQLPNSFSRFQRLNLLIETSSAVYRDADHRLIADAWLRLSNHQAAADGTRRGGARSKGARSTGAAKGVTTRKSGRESNAGEAADSVHGTR